MDIERDVMRSKIFLAIVMTGILTMSTMGCGVPKSEHEKIVQELDKANQEKATLSDQVNKLKAENESLSQKSSQLESELTTLKKENEDLKAKLSAAATKKPAAQKPAAQPKAKKK